ARFQAVLTYGKFDLTRVWIETDWKLVREMLAELLQVAGGVWRRDLCEAASARSNGDGFGHSLLSTVLAAASRTAAIFSADAPSSGPRRRRRRRATFRFSIARMTGEGTWPWPCASLEPMRDSSSSAAALLASRKA